MAAFNLLNFLWQVEAVVFTEDLKQLYVTMKEGFPLEYIVRFISQFSFSEKKMDQCVWLYLDNLMHMHFTQVNIPLDPHLFAKISSSGVDVDLLQRRQSHYLLKVAIALLPGILILWFIREAVMLLHITNKRFLYKKYNQLFDMAYAENFILVYINFYCKHYSLSFANYMPP